MQKFFEKKGNLSFIAGAVYKNVLYYSSYNFGGIWKLDLIDGKTEMIALIENNRKHEFAFRINEQIWFVPAYQEKNVFDVFDINSGVVKSIPVMPIKNENIMKRKYSNFVEFDNEIWVMPSTIEYIVIIEKNSGKLRYILLSDIKMNIDDNYFVGATNIENDIYMYEAVSGQLVIINIETKETSYINLKLNEKHCTYRSILKYENFLFIIPKNLNGNAILKYDVKKKSVVEERIIVNDINLGELIYTGSILMKNSIFFVPYNINKIIKWEIGGEIEWIDINCQQDKTFQSLCCWEAIKTDNGFLFGIEKYGAPIIYIKDDERIVLIESKVNELKDGLLKILL